MSNTRATRQNRSYKLREYTPTWTTMFQDIKSKLVPIFGDNLVAIEHIGSTSVPGMLAKPQIDILVTTKNIEAVKAMYPQMISIGFTPRGDYIEQQEESFILAD